MNLERTYLKGYGVLNSANTKIEHSKAKIFIIVVLKIKPKYTSLLFHTF